MKKLIVPLIAGLLMTGAFAQTPVAPTAATTGASTAPMGEGTKGDVKKTTAKKHMKHMKHMKAKTATVSKAAAS